MRNWRRRGYLRPRKPSGALETAAWHGLVWLAVANVIGVWLAILLLVPSAGGWLGEWTYGRLMPVHLNFQLYGWFCMPLVAWLLKLYRADREPYARWSVVALWMWGLALLLGAVSWLNGHSSGKLFLDWSGFTRIYFPLAIVFLWFVLLVSLMRTWNDPADPTVARIAKVVGLCVLFVIPFLIYAAANPAIYPAVNPDSGGPTGASQLESALVIVLILFLLPYGLNERMRHRKLWIRTGWIVLGIEALLCLGIGHGDVSHHKPVQFISLGSLLIWVLLIPAYYRGFLWQKRSRLWLNATLFWWALLIPTGWCLFLPGILDHLKFTDGLVSHSLMAMAGFCTSLLVLILAVLLGQDGDIFDTRWAFYAWHGGTLLYVMVMIYAGWLEGNNPAFTIVPSTTRDTLYVLRLLSGTAMAAASIDWAARLTWRMYLRGRLSLSQDMPEQTVTAGAA